MKFGMEILFEEEEISYHIQNLDYLNFDFEFLVDFQKSIRSEWVKKPKRPHLDKYDFDIRRRLVTN